MALSQHALSAQNLLAGKQTSRSELAALIPEDPVDLALKELVVKYGTKLGNSKEGFHVHNKDDLTQFMQLNYAHLTVWAEEIVSPSLDVTVNLLHGH